MRWLVILCVLLTTSAFSQDKNYQIDCDSLSLTAVLSALEGEYGLKFSYDPVQVDKFNIHGTFSGVTGDQLVDAIFDELPFEIKKAKSIFLIIPVEIRNPKLYLTGRIFDKETGSPLAYATVLTNANIGVVSNPQGEFRIESPKDSLLITVNYLGFQSSKVWLTPNLENISIAMQYNSNELPEFIISADQGLENKRVSSFSINPSHVNTLPFLGETDLFKALQLLPGIKATDESSAGLFVRGSSPDQNLVMLDGFTLYHLDHFFGIFSTFNPYTVEHIDLYKGGFGAKYGGRTSAVIDAKTKAGSFEKVQGGVGVNSTSINAYLEVPIFKNASIITGFRRSYYDVVKNQIYNSFIDKVRVDLLNASYPDFSTNVLSVDPDFNFYDFYSKLRFKPRVDETIDLNIYQSQDRYTGLKTEETGFSFFTIEDNATWSNFGTSINWRKGWSRNFFSEVSVGFSKYNGESALQSREVFDATVDITEVEGLFLNDSTLLYYDYRKDNSITDVTVKWNQEYDYNQFNTLNFGIEINSYQTKYSIAYLDIISDDFNAESSVVSVFAENQLRKNGWEFNSGLRFNSYELTQTQLIEPRLNLGYRVSDNFKIHTTWSKHNQFINRVSISPFGNSDQFYWVLADDEFYSIQKSEHLMLGFSAGGNHWTIDAEYYRKKTRGLLESQFALFSPFNGLSILEFNDLVTSGSNTAEGLDVFVKYKDRSYSSWISYTLSKSINRFEFLNEGEPYPSSIDQRHELNWTHVLKLGNWEISSIFIYGSGVPYTPPGEISADRQILFDIDQFNAKRIPEYHRLDFSVKYKGGFGLLRLETGLTLFNVYNRQNIKSIRYGLRYNYNQSEARIDSFTAYPIDLKLLGFTPNVFIKLRF